MSNTCLIGQQTVDHLKINGQCIHTCYTQGSTILEQDESILLACKSVSHRGLNLPDKQKHKKKMFNVAHFQWPATNNLIFKELNFIIASHIKQYHT